MLLTFGLFVFSVINAFVLFLTDKLLEGFEIESLTTTQIGAVALTVAERCLEASALLIDGKGDAWCGQGKQLGMPLIDNSGEARVGERCGRKTP